MIRDASIRAASLIAARDHLFNARSALGKAHEPELEGIVEILREMIKELQCSTASR